MKKTRLMFFWNSKGQNIISLREGKGGTMYFKDTLKGLDPSSAENIPPTYLSPKPLQF